MDAKCSARASKPDSHGLDRNTKEKNSQPQNKKSKHGLSNGEQFLSAFEKMKKHDGRIPTKKQKQSKTIISSRLQNTSVLHSFEIVQRGAHTDETILNNLIETRKKGLGLFLFEGWIRKLYYRYCYDSYDNQYQA